VIDLRDANPVPPGLSDGWSQSAEGRATRARVESSGLAVRRRSPRPVRTVAVAAAVVLALVASVLVVQGGSDTPTPTAAGSVVDRLAQGKWKELDPGPAEVLTDLSSVWTGKRLIALGYRISPAAPEAASFNPRTGTWWTVPSPPAGVRKGALVVWTGTEMIVWGGGDTTGPSVESRQDGIVYDPRTEQWRGMSAAPFAPADGTTATWTGRELLVTNGYSERCLSVSASSCYPDAASYDPATDTWDTVPDPPVSLRGNNSIRATWTGRDVVYVVPSGTLAARAAVAFDPELRTWRRLEPPFATGTFGAVGLVRDGRAAASVSWNTHDLEWVRLTADGRWVRGGQDLRHPFICGVEASPVPRGAAVRCDQRHLIGLDLTSARWYRFPSAPRPLPPSVFWTGRELLAFTNQHLLALEPAAE
jgi:hypothetical protein